MIVTHYARVSSEQQASDNSVSINEQISAQRGLSESKNWKVAAEFIDSQNYIATQSPNRGKLVNPSGERADRPDFLKMLDLIRTGTIDAVLCWRDDRLIRHPRVNVALIDALDDGDRHRPGEDKIKIIDTSGAILDRFTMSIKAAVWQEENKRRVERARLGKIGTIRMGRWPARYNCLGYQAIKETGQRGYRIALADDEEVKTVKDIFNWTDQGETVVKIRKKLITSGRQQKGGSQPRKRQWDRGVIRNILHNEAYTGKLTACFANGEEHSIMIPQMVAPEQFARVQKQITQNRNVALRNTKAIYVLQHVVRSVAALFDMVTKKQKGTKNSAMTLRTQDECITVLRPMTRMMVPRIGGAVPSNGVYGVS